jgi:methionyl-tRNA formyltransferase
VKIGYFADGPWSHEALEKIVEDKRFKIAFIVPRYDSRDPVLKEWASKLAVDFLPIENVNHPDAISQLQRYGADLFVSMSFNQILRKQILSIPLKGFINCHAGALPFYRGRNILNWVLINDEKEFGVTAHYIDEGIDTGDIILQKKSLITDEDNYSTLLARAIGLCAEVLYEALVSIETNSVKRIVQSEIHPVGSYFGRRRIGDEWIDWNWTSRRIFNFVRAISTPGPCARTLFNDNEIAVHRASLINQAPKYLSTAGEVVGRENDFLIVKTGDSVIRIEAFNCDGSAVGGNCSDDGMRPKIHIGSRLGVDVSTELMMLKKRVIELEGMK